MAQKAVHIIKHEKEWTETWSKGGVPAEVICGDIHFLCGKIVEWVRFPDDKPRDKVEARVLPTCKKCLKQKGQVQIAL